MEKPRVTMFEAVYTKQTRYKVKITTAHPLEVSA